MQNNFQYHALDNCFAQFQDSSVRLEMPKRQISPVIKIFITYIFSNLSNNE